MKNLKRGKVERRRRTIRGMKFHTCRVEFLTTRGGGGGEGEGRGGRGGEIIGEF